jgi:hypothetical protein
MKLKNQTLNIFCSVASFYELNLQELTFLHGGTRWAHLSFGIQLTSTKFEFNMKGISNNLARTAINVTHANTFG